MRTYVIVDAVEQNAIRDAMIALESGAGMTWSQYVDAVAEDADVDPDTADAMIEVLTGETAARLKARRACLH